MPLETFANQLGIPAPRLNYLVHVDDKRRIVYFETPKVACTSIKKYMQDQYVGGVHELSAPGKVHDRSLSPLKALRELTDDQIEAVLFGKYRRFAFVRDPFTRVLSAYLDKLVTNEWERERHLPKLGFELGSYPSFSEFLTRVAERPDAERDIHYATQDSLLLRGRIDFAFVGRFERFAADFARLKSEYYGDGSLDDYASFGKHHQTGASEKLRQHLGPSETTLAAHVYAADFDRFGYAPTLAVEAAPSPAE